MTQELFSNEEQHTNGPVTVLGKTFANDDERRAYFREELRKKLPELKEIEGFPIGEDEDIINLSDPPFYTACPNPWINDFVAEWEEEKKQLEKEGKRVPDFEVTEPYPLDINAGKNHAIYNAHSYHTKVPHEIITKFLLYYTQPGDVILDSFAGTGMTGVASSFCESIVQDKDNCSRIKSEFVSNNLNINLGKRNAINIDLSTIASHISYIYNQEFDINLFKKEFEKLMKSLDNYSKVYNYQGLKINYSVYSQIYICDNCQNDFSYLEGAYVDNSILRKNVVCPHCNYETNKSKLNPKYETIVDKIDNEVLKQVVYKKCLVNYSKANKRIIEEVDGNKTETKITYPHLISNKILIDGVETKRNVKYGIEKVHHFYTDNTLNLISVYLNEIQNLKLKNHFLFLLTAVLPKLTKLNRYMPQHGSRALVGPMANTLYLPPLYVENNFLDQIEFQFNKICKALIFSRKQLVSQQSATSIVNLNSSSIDYIYIDPPFGANIMYSELNNLSENWLKIITNNKEEAIESKGQNKSKFEYELLMDKSFRELFRVLKPGKWMTVEFSNTSAAIWNIIQNGLNKVGFIISKIDGLNKERGGLHAMLGPVAVKQDLAITCYKPSSEFDTKFQESQHSPMGVWDFVEEHLSHLPIHLVKDNSTTAIIERSAKILFDRLIAFYVQRSLPVPIDAGKFQEGLKERFVERDGMYFTQEQVEEYERKKAEVPEFIQMSLFVGSEQDAVYWLRQLLEKEHRTEQDLHPLWMREVAGNMRKGDTLPEMRQILEENFLKDDTGKWYVPDAENEADLEKLRNKRLLKIFEDYKAEAAKPKGKLKEVRVEALRVGFKQCYQDKDFKTIVNVGDRIPNNLLMEDEVLLQFYDIASAKI